MTQTPDTSAAEFNAVLKMLISEREDGRTKLDVAQLAVLRKAAKLMVSDDPHDAKDLVELMKLCAPVVRRVRVEPSLDELCDPAREWNLEALDDADVEQLDRIMALATGRAEYVPDARWAAALRLVRVVAGVGDVTDLLPGEHRDLLNEVKREVIAVIRPLDPAEVFSVELSARSAERVELKSQVERLERELHMADSRASGKVTDLAAARA